jgi:glycosyltransferase involved in cell wall biosynthesis
MTIGVNGYEAVIPRFGYDKNGLPHRVGSSEVCYQLLVELAKIDKKNQYLIYLPVEPTSDMPQESDNWQYEVIPSGKLWTMLGLTRALMKKPALDVFFSPTHYGPLYTPCPEIISILDVSYKRFPELFTAKDKAQLALWGKYSLNHASKIITISNSSKDDIIEEYKIQPQKVTVVHLGIKNESRSMNHESGEKMMDKLGIKKPYILFVGTLQPRKNIARLIEALSLLSDKDVNLVVIGRRGWHYEDILSAPTRFGVEDRVKFLENVSDEDLPEFYKEAELFVLPSLYEGFGLPVLEAMKNGCPVATSDISSLPEAGGDAAAYFNPEDATDIAKTIEKILSDAKLRSDMIKKGHEQVKKFSWEKAAREVIDVFEEVGGKGI